MKPRTLAFIFALLTSLSVADTVPMTAATMLAEPFLVRITLVAPKLIDAGLPVPTRQRIPEYPLVMREARIQGEARISLTVERDGRITNVKLVRASEESFGEAALRAAKSWRFTPGKGRDGYLSRDLEYAVAFELP